MTIKTRIWATFLPVTLILMCIVAFLSLRHARRSYWAAEETSHDLLQLRSRVSEIGRQIEAMISPADREDFRELEWRLGEAVSEAGRHSQQSKHSALKFTQQFIIVSTASIILVTLLCLAMARYISHPIQIMRGRARRIADGDLARTEPLKSYGEMSDLANDIEQMRVRIASQIKQLDDRVAETGRELHHTEKQYQLLFNAMTAGSAFHEIVCDDEGRPIDYRFLEVNPAFEASTGLKRENVVGKRATDVLPGLEPFWVQTYGEVALTGNAATFEHYSEELGKHFQVHAYSPQQNHFAVIFSDVTQQKQIEVERRRLERQVQHAQKLESLGVLAGGIAHDFNNLLMGILGNADLALSQIGPDAPGKEELNEIEKASRRAAELCKQMLAYSGKGRFVVEPLDLSRLVTDMEHMLRVSISKTSVLDLTLADGLPAVEGDATQIRQIIMNLVINASESVGEKSGTISVITGVMDCTRAYLQETYLDEDLPPGPYAFVEVRDTGCGMSREVKERIFEPFFTTKFAGRGLGMAAVLGILRGHRGAVKMSSEENVGTTFRVLFPVSAHAARGPATPVEVQSDWTGRGTVLLADDEDLVRAVGGLMLERAGFEVLTAVDGREAVELFKREAGSIACVVLDLTMPHMGGEEALRQMREIRDDVPVILSSGYSEQDVVSRFAGKGMAAFIQKPYHSSTLIDTLRGVLQDSAEAKGSGA